VKEHVVGARLAATGQCEVTLYTRLRCHFCEEAKVAIAPLLLEFGASLREANIEQDAVLEECCGWHIPVIFIAARKSTKHRVDVEQFRYQL
jgi:hypothetical protein